MKKNKSEELENFYTKKAVAKNVPKLEKLKNNEILVDVIKEKPKKSTIKKKVKTKKKNAKEKKQNKNKEKTKKRKVVCSAKQKHRIKIVKWTSILILFIVAIILFMLSSVFNIKNITVLNNSKVSTTEIINNSGIQIGENIFKINKNNMKENIKQNAYIESIKVTKDIMTMTLNIEIKERETTYMIKYANAYVYLNNQGYILEISDSAIEVPILIGLDTETQDIEVGKRLNNTDLYKLDGVLKITESAKSYNIKKLITEIDISDEKDYTLNMINGDIIVYFGNSSNVNEKVRLIERMLKTEEGNKGEFFVNEMDEGDNTYFRERV